MQHLNKLIGHRHKEFIDQPLKVISGALPPGLRGSLYRNSLLLQNRKNGLPGHIFDGDGAILHVQFRDSAIGTYKFTKTPEFVAEQSADEYIYSALGRKPNGNWMQRILSSMRIKNPTNTSVLPLQNGPLLSLWEGGHPYALEKQTLNMIGKYNCGVLKQNQQFSAHPKVCPKTNLIYNQGMEFGWRPAVNVMEMNQQGQILKMNKAQLKGNRTMIHDFVLAGQYLIVPVFPCFYTSIWSVLCGNKSFGEALAYKPEAGIQILIFDRYNNLELVSDTVVNDMFFAWHYINGYVNEQGNIVMDYVANRNMDSFKMSYTKNILASPGYCKSWYERMIINPQEGRILSRDKIHDDLIEFPTIDDVDVGSKWDTTYATTSINEIIKYSKGNKLVKSFGNRVPSELSFVQDKSKSKGQGWVISVAFDSSNLLSSIDVMDSESLDTVCSLELPEVIGMILHGRFQQD